MAILRRKNLLNWPYAIYAEWNFMPLSIGHIHFEFLSAEPDQMPRLVASDLALHCLPMSNKINAWLIQVKFVCLSCIQMYG